MVVVVVVVGVGVVVVVGVGVDQAAPPARQVAAHPLCAAVTKVNRPSA